MMTGKVKQAVRVEKGIEMTLREILFILLRAEICGQELPDEVQAQLTEEGLEKLYSLSKAQDLAHLVGDALLRNNILSQNKELCQKFIVQRRMAIYRREQLNYELKTICSLFSEANIEHLPLKGSILQAYYPENWMRTSCDIDILVKKENVDACVKALCENGYTLEGDHFHDMSLYSANNVHLELHYNLIEESRFPKIAGIVSNVWEYVQATENGYTLHTSPEFFIFYHIARMAKHFINGGCGIRPFLDLWIMENKMPYDQEKLNVMLQDGGLLPFYEHALALSNHWFSQTEADDVIQDMEDYVLRGGIYGTLENKVSVSREKPKSKAAYLKAAIFLPYANLCKLYPSLQGKKWLTPFYQVRRWFRIVFKGTSTDAHATLRAYDHVSEEQKQRVQNLLKTLSL